MFPRPFAWSDRKGTAWFGILVGTALPSLLMLWRYNTKTGLTVFTYLVDLTVVTVAIPYFMSAIAQLTFLVSRRRRVNGWALARDLMVAGHQRAVLHVGDVRLGVPGRLPGPRRDPGRADPLRLPERPPPAPRRGGRADGPPAGGRRRPSSPSRPDAPLSSEKEITMTFHVDSEIGQLHQAIVHRPGLELSRLTPDNIGELLFDDVMWASQGQGGARRLRRGPA